MLIVLAFLKLIFYLCCLVGFISMFIAMTPGEEGSGTLTFVICCIVAFIIVVIMHFTGG